MSLHEREPQLSEELAALVKSERNEVHAPADAAKRVWQSVANRIGTPDDDGSGNGGTDGNETTEHESGTSGGRAAGSSKLGGLSPGNATGITLSGPVLSVVLSTTLVVGGGIGASIAPARDRIIYVDRHVATTIPGEVRNALVNAADSNPGDAGLTVLLPQTLAPPTLKSASKVSSAGLKRAVNSEQTPIGATQLTAERSILDEARAALTEGEPQRALHAVGEHEKRFNHGALTEEREALAVKALAQLGDITQARTRGAKFHTLFPKSAFGRSVDSFIERSAVRDASDDE